MPVREATSRLATSSFLIGVIFAGGTAAADMPSLGSDGWHTWRVAAAEHAPEWCCYTWNQGRKSTEGCDLDVDRRGYGTSDRPFGSVDQVQLYVRVENDAIAEIRPLSPRCPIDTDDGIVDLGIVATEDSIAWLTPFVDSQNDLIDDALAAISAHQTAVPELIRVISRPDLDIDTREQALYWLAMADTDEAMSFFEQLLTGG